MRALLILGVIVLIVGICSFFVGVPRTESNGVKIAGATIGVETRHTERMPQSASIALVVGGIVLMAIGGRGTK
jgi:hypothetical protein